jgi:hypothetical protein
MPHDPQRVKTDLPQNAHSATGGHVTTTGTDEHAAGEAPATQLVERDVVSIDRPALPYSAPPLQKSGEAVTIDQSTPRDSAFLDAATQSLASGQTSRAKLSTSTENSTASLPSGSAARYRVLRSHAKGGLGEVFVAHDVELNRDVALKEIQERFTNSPESRSRFLFEAEITGRLEHPGIVPVYGMGEYADGRPYYAMRFIKGQSFRDVIEQFHRAYDRRTAFTSGRQR